MKILRHWHKWLDAFCLHSCTYNSLSFTGIVNCYHYFEQICNSDLNLSSSVQMTSLMTTWAIFFCFILTCYLYLYKKVFHFIYNYLGTKSLLFYLPSFKWSFLDNRLTYVSKLSTWTQKGLFVVDSSFRQRVSNHQETGT